LLGTGGTLKRNSNIFKDDTFFIAHADNLCLTDFSAFFSAHRNRPHECKITMMTFIPPDPKQCGVVELSQDNIVIGFHEKVLNPPTHLANGAVFLMEGSVASFASNYPSDVFEISRDIIPAFLGKIITWHNDDYHLDIGTPDTYARAQSDVEIIRSLVDKYGIQRI